MARLKIEAVAEVWPLREAFSISRGAKTEARVIVVTASDGRFEGRGEAVPYARYGESIDSALDDIRNVAAHVESRAQLQDVMKPGAARNAVDCALWDLEAKSAETTVAATAGVPPPGPTVTAFTISLDKPDVMAGKAAAARALPLLKLKLGGEGDAERMRAVRTARPDARLIVDANEAWTPALWSALSRAAQETGVEAIEQPFAADSDQILERLARPVPVCADESVHTTDDLARLSALYDAINIKLDKAGGLTAALALQRAARARGFRIMIGSMVATSLAVAPALLLSPGADWVDLDGPMLLSRDRDGGLRIEDGVIMPAESALWG